MRTPYQVIYAVRLDLGGVSLVVPVNRDGQPLKCDTLDGTPRPPKPRTSDLRIGDYVSRCGTWRRIDGISADSCGYMTERQSTQYRGPGFVYLPRRR
jgi:hypothetical protein